MKVVYTRRFLRSYRKIPEEKKRRFEKQLAFLLQDPRHPSLRAKIVDQERRIWQGRVDRDWRFYFQLREETCSLLDIVPHP